MKERKDLREKIASTILQRESYDFYKTADQILALLPSLEGIEVEEECPECGGRKMILADYVVDENDRPDFVNCPTCNPMGEKGKISTLRSIGKIRRPAMWEEKEELWNITIQECVSCEGRLLPSGVKIIRKDK